MITHHEISPSSLQSLQVESNPRRRISPFPGSGERAPEQLYTALRARLGCRPAHGPSPGSWGSSDGSAPAVRYEGRAAAARWDAGPCRHGGVWEARRVWGQARPAFASSHQRFLQFPGLFSSTPLREARPRQHTPPRDPRLPRAVTARRCPRAGPRRAEPGQERGAAIG